MVCLLPGIINALGLPRNSPGLTHLSFIVDSDVIDETDLELFLNLNSDVGDWNILLPIDAIGGKININSILVLEDDNSKLNQS